MLQGIKNIVKRALYPEKKEIHIGWVQRDPDSWLAQQYAAETIKPPRTPFSGKIEQLATATSKLGPQPLWDGYKAGDPTNARGSTRNADEVRTARVVGDLYADIVIRRKPDIVVEFGTAFGVSGMYFLAGLETNKRGQLYTYDPNNVWAGIAKNNLSRISGRFTQTVGTFEENIARHLENGKRIDLAFIDAIHTSEFVRPQLEIVIARSGPKAIIILDDIGFSADMRKYWYTVALDRRFSASATLGDRVGIVELKA